MKILIVRLGALGDIIQSAVVLQFIKKRVPDIEIHWLLEKQYQGILENNPFIDKIHTVHIKKFKESRKIKDLNLEKKVVKEIGEKENYDLVIDMQGLIKSALVSKLISKKVHGYSYSSIKEGFASLLYSSTSTISYSDNTIFRNLKLIEDSLKMAEITGSDLFHKEKYLFSSSRVPIDFQIGLVIGSTWPSRNYPKEKFLQIIEAFPEKRFGVIWGSDGEREVAEWLSEKAENCTVAPKTDLDGLKSIVDQVDLIVGNDTGPTHLAWAVNTSSITIFGPTPTSRVFQTPHNLVVKSNSKVNPKKLNRLDFSIVDIDSSIVVEKMKTLL
jgi:heptosyltransferase-1